MDVVARVRAGATALRFVHDSRGRGWTTRLPSVGSREPRPIPQAMLDPFPYCAQSFHRTDVAAQSNDLNRDLVAAFPGGTLRPLDPASTSSSAARCACLCR